MKNCLQPTSPLFSTSLPPSLPYSHTKSILVTLPEMFAPYNKGKIGWKLTLLQTADK